MRAIDHSRKCQTGEEVAAPGVPHSSPPVLLPLALLALIAWGCFAHSVGFGFSPFDDRRLFVEDLERFSSVERVPSYFTMRVFPDLEVDYYRPLLLLSFLVDGLLGGGAPWAFHLGNVILHGIVVALLFLFLGAIGAGRLPAFVMSALFAVHPLHVHGVVWIPGRNDLLLSIAVLVMFFSCTRYLTEKKIRWYVLHLLVFLCALFTKENAVFMPVVLFFWCTLCVRDRSPKSILLLGAGWAAVFCGWYVARSFMVEGYTTANAMALSDLAVNMPKAFVVYCGKFFLPLYQKISPVLRDTPVLPFAIVLAVVGGVVAFTGVRDRRRAAIGALWFVLFLVVPVLFHFTNNEDANIEEHRIYLPSIGILVVLGQVRWERIAGKLDRRVGLVLLAVLLGVCVWRVQVRSAPYETMTTFIERAVEESPGNGHVFAIRGELLLQQGKHAEALRAVERGIELKPNDPEGYNYRAAILMELGRVDEALRSYSRAIAMKRRAHYLRNRGIAFARIGAFRKAIRDISAALDLRGPDAGYLCERGSVFARTGDRRAALSDFDRARAADPELTQRYIAENGWLGEFVPGLFPGRN